MSMRARLSLAIGAVIVVTLLLFSVIVVRDTRSALTSQVDAQVKDFSKRTSPKPGNDDYGPNGGRNWPGAYVTPTEVDNAPSAASAGDQTTPVAKPTPDDFGPGKQDVAHFVYDASGNLTVNEPSGYHDNPDAAPELPDIPSARLDSILGQIVTLPTIDGANDFRVLVERLPNGTYNVSAASLSNVDDAIGNLVRFLSLGGSVAVLFALLASWLLIRRGLKPVDRMVETATAIAAGDLSRRVADSDPRTELGRLGSALNEMLSQIEHAMQIQTASEDRLRRFVADAAHELRTPLTSLRGYAELYRQGALPTEEGVSRAMSRIESEGSRMARLVEDLLLLARLDQQRGLERTRLNVSSLVADAVSDFRVAQPERDITSGITADLMVIGDPLRLRQVFDNLLSNARAHTPVEAAIRVDVARVDDRVRIMVSDDGPGISKDDQTRIFERFWRADPARTRKGGGSGLGLSITASLVDAQGGSIEVDSEPGHGTTFNIWFPLAPPADIDAPVEEGGTN